MADYEELAELGFEGVDKFANKYHDKVYDHLPAWKQKQKRQEARAKKDDHQQQRQHSRGPPENEQERSRQDSPVERSRNVNFEDDQREMSSYAPSHAPSYAPTARQDQRQDYREDRAPRADWAYQPRAPSPPPEYAGGYDVRRNEPQRGRPAPSRMRSSSWSPPRNERAHDDSRRRRRSRSRSRSSSNDGTRTQRIAATLIGGLVGGMAGNQFRKGQKYDTAATIGGAVLGGIASRELAERIGGKKEDRKERRQTEQEAWEARHGDGGRDDDRRRSRDGRDSRGGRDDRDSRGDRDSRDSRGWCDRCRCERSRCWCR
ncbi:hypothetical protein CC86DRAFT_448238 [Ophiobolus disseminans]|uniref:Glycine zipper 2TM domain-containing protein n=1 Tax=Ophiobolus disseminans TaxID=1469910 RepID=A0A6A6ZPW1_9PLEO|nr:hypothetical protein CC86DRAFT_448238 [Ophiobolus disseminans]